VGHVPPRAHDVPPHAAAHHHARQAVRHDAPPR
jgi:hypothetical protein